MDKSLLPQGTRALFPIKAQRAYLNNASIAPMSLPVIAAVDAFTADVRDFCRNNYPEWCRRADTEVKERIGRLIDAHRSEIAFAKNTTEGLVTVANGLKWREGDNVVIGAIEYPSNVYCWMNLRHRRSRLARSTMMQRTSRRCWVRSARNRPCGARAQTAITCPVAYDQGGGVHGSLFSEARSGLAAGVRARDPGVHPRSGDGRYR